MEKLTISPRLRVLPRKARQVTKLRRVKVSRIPPKSLYERLSDQDALQKQVVKVGELERQRIGRDLHDSLGGHLTGIAMLAKALMQKLASKGVVEASIAEEVVVEIGHAIVRTRDIAHRLCPIEAGAEGLVGNLGKLAAEVCRWSGTDCRFRAEEGVCIQDSRVASHLFRIAEEAVQNALRHAHARRIEIQLGNTHRGILLRIWNNGDALPARAVAAQGLGLCSMKYRAAIIRSRLEIRNARVGGTEVCCLLPRTNGKLR